MNDTFKNMDETLEAQKREALLECLCQCKPHQQFIFNKMYAGAGNFEQSPSITVANMDTDKLGTAMDQVERTLKINEKRAIDPAA